jgi:serine/threonine protein kinase
MLQWPPIALVRFLRCFISVCDNESSYALFFRTARAVRQTSIHLIADSRGTAETLAFQTGVKKIRRGKTARIVARDLPRSLSKMAQTNVPDEPFSPEGVSTPPIRKRRVTFKVPSTSPSSGDAGSSGGRRGRHSRVFRVLSASTSSSSPSEDDDDHATTALRDFSGQQAVDYTINQRRSRTPLATIDTIGDILRGHENLTQLLDHQGFGTANAERTTTWTYGNAGTLAQLIESVRQPRRRRQPRGRAPSPGLPTRPFPGLSESFIWHTLKSLLKATLYLHTGRSDLEDADDHSTWQPIVHNHINPDNIFLSDPPAGQEHQHCRLGNFTRCVVLPSKRGPTNDIEWGQQAQAFTQYPKDQQTGYEAPELMDNEHVEHPPGRESDLWSIGAVAVTMMTGYNFWDLLREMAFHDHVRGRPPTGRLIERWRDQSTRKRLELLSNVSSTGHIVDALPGHYSVDLRVVATLVLTLSPLDRGDALTTLQEVEQRFENARAQGFHEPHEPTAIERGDAAIAAADATIRLPRVAR